MFLQLFVRIAIAAGFLSAVADRLGLWGEPGGRYAVWGDWNTFVAYANQLNFFVPGFLQEPLAITATILETVFAGLLLLGYKTKTTANLSGLLLLAFALAMALAFGLKSTFDYSVWMGSGACFLLANAGKYRWSVDRWFEKRKRDALTG